jgi:hypothetical protein
VREPIVLEDGHVRVPTAPGIGVEIDPVALEDATVAGRAAPLTGREAPVVERRAQRGVETRQLSVVTGGSSRGPCGPAPCRGRSPALDDLAQVDAGRRLDRVEARPHARGRLGGHVTGRALAAEHRDRADLVEAARELGHHRHERLERALGEQSLLVLGEGLGLGLDRRRARLSDEAHRVGLGLGAQAGGLRLLRGDLGARLGGLDLAVRRGVRARWRS